MGFTDVGDDRLYVVGAEAFDGWHVPELPVVGADSVLDRQEEGAVAVVARFIYRREEGRTVVGATQIFAVALGAVVGVEDPSFLDQFCVLLRRVAAGACPSAGGQNCQCHCEEGPFHAEGRSWRRRRNWALMATMTVEALIKTAAAAGGRTIPAHARAPAASGIARTL